MRDPYDIQHSKAKKEKGQRHEFDVTTLSQSSDQGDAENDAKTLGEQPGRVGEGGQLLKKPGCVDGIVFGGSRNVRGEHVL